MNLNTKPYLFILVFCFFYSFNYAQKVNLNKTITLSITDSTLTYLLTYLSENEDINFSFNPAKIPLDSLVSIHVNEQKIADVLKDVFQKLNIEYTIVEEQVIIKQKEKPKPPKEEKPKEFTISGYVRELKSSENLIGATVYVEGTTTGTITNAYGFYSLTLPAGNYNIIFSFIGLQNELRTIELKKNETINIDLFPNLSILTEIVVSASEKENIIELNQMSELKVKPKILNSINGFMGEPDLIKAFQLMPGIKLMGDGSTSFFVRGGHLDQNLILIDEAPIYNAAHLFGFFSVFVNDAVKDINIYKGDMPAEYGGRLSSLIDVKTKDGNMNKLHASGSYGLVSATVSVEGPIRKQKSSFFISARRSHLSWLLGKNKDNLKIYFYDINAKFNRKINQNNRLYFSVYFGKDYLSQINTSITSSGISWGNSTATLRWNHIFSEKLFANFTLNASKYNYYLYLSVKNNQYWNSFIGNGGVKADFTYYFNPANTLKFGLKSTSHNFNPGNLEINGNVMEGIPVTPRNQAEEKVLYVSNQQIISDKLSLRYGLRYTNWQNTGPATVYFYDENYQPVQVTNYETKKTYNTYRTLEPRLNVNFKLNEKTAFKASYVNTSQNIHLISNSISPFTSLEVWFPSNPNIKPERANQIAMGMFRKNRDKNNFFSAELFYKKMKNQIDYIDHAQMLLNPLIEGELRFGTTRCYGIELSYKKTTEQLTAWINYTYSRSLRKTDGINFNKQYPSLADRPNDFSVHINYKTKKRWQYSVNWMYISGGVFSSPTAFYNYNNYSVPVYLYKNNDRLPAYHRLDVSATIQLSKESRKYKHHLTFSIFNLYGRKNPVSINFNKTIDAYGNFKIPANLYQVSELVPTQLTILRFMPSITYNFSF
ncbi:MAG: TonB-dependent receptor [Chlorobi bacterium]|nr:TonB-dependent receptor [Chlorobiota bacterium]